MFRNQNLALVTARYRRKLRIASRNIGRTPITDFYFCYFAIMELRQNFVDGHFIFSMNELEKVEMSKILFVRF